MKIIYFLLIITLFEIDNVSAVKVADACHNEYLDPFKTIVSTIIDIIKIGVPIILIVLGMIDMAKAVATQKDEKIKEGQKNLLSRLLTGAVVFFIVAIVQLLVNIIGDNIVDDTIWDCVEGFINGTVG